MREIYNVAMDLYTNHTVVYYYLWGMGALSGVLLREFVPGMIEDLKGLINKYGIPVKKPKK